MELSSRELARYDRHITLPEVGLEGQKKLKEARVLVVGSGGLGSPVCLYLAAAGIGTLGVLDFDTVDESNLQRQVLFGTSDVGRSKALSAQERLRDLNPEISVKVHQARLEASNALGLLKDYQLVVDGTDNFATRYLINDACVLLGIPSIYGSIFRFQGQVSVFDTVNGGPCYRCLYPEPPPNHLVPSCAEGGVLGVLPGVVGTLQATEVVKLILGVGETLRGRLLTFDALKMKFRELKLPKADNCPICGSNPTITELVDYEEFCGLEQKPSGPELTVMEFKKQWAEGRRPVLIDVRESYEWKISNLADYGAKLVTGGSPDVLLKDYRADDDIVVYCKSGMRSQKAQSGLLQAGFTNVRSLAGGIQAWEA